MASRYRRRRAGALAVVAGVALVLGVVAGAGSGGAGGGRSAAAHRTGFFTRIHTLAGNGAGSFARAQATAESAAITRTLAYTPYVWIAGSQHREVALTFDDGPGPYTLRLLSVLDRYHVPATFFEVGAEEQYFHAATTAIITHGDPIGDHTQTHAAMSNLPPRAQQSQLLRDTASIGDFGAPFPRMFRPPYGLWDKGTLALLKKYRMLMVMWTVDTSDYQRPGTRAIIDQAVKGAKPGAIVLMHDAGGDRTQTIVALPQIIKRLRAKGYKLVTVPRLLLDNPAPKNQDVEAFAGAGG